MRHIFCAFIIDYIKYFLLHLLRIWARVEIHPTGSEDQQRKYFMINRVMDPRVWKSDERKWYISFSRREQLKKKVDCEYRSWNSHPIRIYYYALVIYMQSFAIQHTPVQKQSNVRTNRGGIKWKRNLRFILTLKTIKEREKKRTYEKSKRRTRTLETDVKNKVWLPRRVM